MSTPHVAVSFSGEGPASVLYGVTLINCFSGLTFEATAIEIFGASPTIESCVFVGNGIIVSGNSNPTILGNVFEGYFEFTSLPAIWVSNTSSNSATVTIQDNTFRNMTFEFGNAGAISVSGTGDAVNTGIVERNTFENIDGFAMEFGGTGSVDVYGYAYENVMSECSIGIDIGGISTSQQFGDFANNTIVDCGTGIVKGGNVNSLDIRNTILWLNGDDLNGVGASEISCSDISDGDYLGMNGNISENPMFCDAGTGDYQINSESPCVDGYGCGLIGALGIGCGYLITSIEDVGNDQGRQARVQWSRASHDSAGTQYTVVSYSILRRVDQYLRGTGADLGLEARGSYAYPPGDWDIVVTVPAWGEAEYSTVCPTLCDSTITEGMCWSVFFVRANTSDPLVYFDCNPDSGYSVDNLAPSAPTGLLLANTVLSWAECPDEDFDYFSVYGSNTGDIGDATLIGYTVGPAMDVQAAPFLWYHVTATDFSGNEGAVATVANTTTGVEAEHIRPTRHALHPPQPNPFTEGLSGLSWTDTCSRAGTHRSGTAGIRGAA
jgi:hypothetical protein